MSDHTCELCESRPVSRVVDLGDRQLRVCARCSAEFQLDPGYLLAAVELAYAEEDDVSNELSGLRDRPNLASREVCLLADVEDDGVPLPGDAAFPTAVEWWLEAGALTEIEAKERLELHALVANAKPKGVGA
jgi:hypothetical protein